NHRQHMGIRNSHRHSGSRNFGEIGIIRKSFQDCRQAGDAMFGVRY
ncbi:MAG: hypothetical protein ACI92S_005186, partial [Planctomycetaceae bacterium]